MNFFIQKILSAAILPLPLALLCLVLALVLTLFRRRVAALSIGLLGVIILIAFSLPYLPDAMLKSLETKYQPLTQFPSGINTIVVLGAGNGGYPRYPANDKLSAASLARLVEAIRIYKHLGQAKLLLSGGRVFGSPPDADAMNNVASLLGISPQDIIIENGSQDTYQEALFLHKLLKNQPFILVTSAYHMPRAMRLFEKQGMHPTAAPTEFLEGKRRYSIKRYFPSAASLLYSDIALHEYFGLWWSQLTGKI